MGRSREYELISRKVFENAITLVKNDDLLIPLQKLDTLKIASLSIGANIDNPFNETLNLYAPMDLFDLPSTPNEAAVAAMLKKLEGYNLVVVGIHNTSQSSRRNFGLSDYTLKLITS